MPYAHNAEFWCDACGKTLGLPGTGYAPVEPTDGPSHCAAREECRAPVDLTPWGEIPELHGAETRQIGALESDELTPEGVEYLRELLNAKDETPYQAALHSYWREVFAVYLDEEEE